MDTGATVLNKRHLPKSSLGMTTGRCFPYDDRDLLIVMKCCFDGSGDGKDASGDDWITLGGVAATDSAWDIFEDRWTRMLQARYPVAPYIHMIELMGHDDPFEFQNGWGLTKKRQ